MDQLSSASELLTIQRALGVVSLAIGIVFAYAAASKLADVDGLVNGIRAAKVIPGQISPLVAILLIIGESSIAVSHLANIGLQFVVPGTIALLATFFMTIVHLLKRGEKSPCLCFGASGDEKVDVYSLARVALLLSSEFLLYFYLAIHGGSIALWADVYNTLELLGVAALIVTLIAWCLSLPRLHGSLRIVTSGAAVKQTEERGTRPWVSS